MEAGPLHAHRRNVDPPRPFFSWDEFEHTHSRFASLVGRFRWPNRHKNTDNSWTPGSYALHGQGIRPGRSRPGLSRMLECQVRTPLLGSQREGKM
jgi:hypothetical protein